MFRWLGEDIDKTPTAYFVPFRSPSWKTLPHSLEALAFAQQLWKPVLAALQPKLIVCIGIDQAFASACQICGAVARQSFPIGWGNYAAQVAVSPSTRVVGLPHLSRFMVFGRPASQAPLAVLRANI
jgi:hypothetical protein